MIEKTELRHLRTIYEPTLWGEQTGYEFSVSDDGALIAVKTRNHGGDHNIFVYKRDGKLVNSFWNGYGPERGIAFWPNRSHLLIPGAKHPDQPGVHGLKLWRWGNPDSYTQPFCDTPLSDTFVDLIGVSKSGRFIAGRNRKTSAIYAIDTNQGNRVIELVTRIYPSRSMFSTNEEFIAITGSSINPTSSVFSLTSGEVIWESKEFSFLCFLPDSNDFWVANSRELVEWNIATLSNHPICKLKAGLVAAAISSNYHFIAAGDTTGAINVWELTDYAQILHSKVHSEQVLLIAWGVDSRTLISSDGTSVEVWQFARL